MELIVKVRGSSLQEIEQGLEDAAALVQAGHTRLEPGEDPEGCLEFEIRESGAASEGFCSSPWAHDECEHG
jgi:hypothetical protein